MADTTSMTSDRPRDAEIIRPGRPQAFNEASSKDPEVIRHRIAQTRAEMGATIDEIQERLSPANLKEQAKETIRDATIGKVEQMTYQAERKAKNWRDNAMQTVRDNPVPVALIGIGLGWLMFAERGNGSDDTYTSAYPYGYEREPAAYGYRYYGQGEQQGGTYGRETGRGMGRGVRERVGEKVEGVQERASHMAEEVSETVENVQERASQAVEGVSEKASRAAQQTQEQMDHLRQETQEQMDYLRRQARTTQRQVKTNFQHMMEENPLAVGAAALALGTIVGLALPKTHYEDEMMGRQRDRLVDEAKEMAQEAAEKVQHVASEAQQAAMETAREEAKRQDMPTTGAGDGGQSRTGTGTEPTTTRTTPTSTRTTYSSGE